MDRVREARPEVEIETIEIMRHSRRTRRAGIMMIPTIEMGGKRWHYVPPLEELLGALDGEPAPRTGGSA